MDIDIHGVLMLMDMVVVMVDIARGTAGGGAVGRAAAGAEAGLQRAGPGAARRCA